MSLIGTEGTDVPSVPIACKVIVKVNITVKAALLGPMASLIYSRAPTKNLVENKELRGQGW